MILLSSLLLLRWYGYCGNAGPICSVGLVETNEIANDIFKLLI